MQTHTNSALIKRLSLFHIFLLTLSNVLVQYPFTLWHFNTTWGAFVYPAIFILTDLTTRLFGAHFARKIIFRSMIPGLFISYLVTSYIENPHTLGWVQLFSLHPIPLRIACACFSAYAIGQLLDIFVFQRYRNHTTWWLAPALSTTVGNLVDTTLFFFIAFYHSSHLFLSQHWPEIAAVDLFFKMAMSLVVFVPAYGVILHQLNLNFYHKYKAYQVN